MQGPWQRKHGKDCELVDLPLSKQRKRLSFGGSLDLAGLTLDAQKNSLTWLFTGKTPFSCETCRQD